MLPVFGLLVHYAGTDRSRRLAEMQEEGLRLSESCAASVAQVVEGARQTLTALAHSAEIRSLDRPSADRLLAGVLEQSSLYGNLAVIGPEGDVLASGIAVDSRINAADRTWFRRLRDKGGLVIGNYEVGRVTRRPSIHIVLRLPGELSGGRAAALLAALRQEALQACLTGINLPEGAIINIVDRNGVVLARNPEPEKWIGKPSRAWPNLKKDPVRSKRFAETEGIDGVSRLYHFSEVPKSDGGLFVGVAVSKALLDAKVRASTIENALWLSLATLVALVAAYVAAHFWILRPVLRLGQAARNIAAGRLDARVGLASGAEEFRQLAENFDAMAAAIERNDVELRRHKELLEARVRERTAALEQANAELKHALAEVKTLSGMLPICSSCKKIRDDKGSWVRMESYISSRSNAQFTHGCCPECMKRLFPDFTQGGDGPGA